MVAAVAALAAAGGYLAVTERVAGPVPGIGRWAATRPLVGPEGGRPSLFGRLVPAVAGTPSRVRIPAIGLDAPLERLQLGADGALVPPRGFGDAGWYAAGTVPGDVGPGVIAGHVDSKSGPAVFYRLRELAVGDRVDVVRGATVVHFVVTRTAWYPKKTFPTGQVYGPTPDRQLRLITCGGVFDRTLRSYRDNLVVYAVAG